MTKIQVLCRALIATVVLAMLGFAMCSFQVASNESAVLTRFGRPVRTLDEAGLYFKWPWPIDAVNRFDKRLTFYETRLSEALTQDKRNVIIPVYVAWRVQDPLKFLQALGTPEAVPSKLDSLTISARNALLGKYNFQQLVATDPAQLRLAEIERLMLETIRPQALEAFGIGIEQIGIKRIALPEANTAFVFEWMRAERGQFAAKFRAEGRREADELKARTDAEKAVLLAEAQKYAEEAKGRGEADAARIYAEAHAKNPAFYQFTRELEALRKAARINTTLILDTDTAPFNQLKAPATKNAPAPAERLPADSNERPR